MRRIASIVLGALCVAAAAVPALADVTEVGVPADAPFSAPGCPANCSAIGRVTGYQAQIGKTRNPMMVRHAGRVVAFTLKLGKPTAAQMRFFQTTFGGQPQARIAILKPAGSGRLTLVAESERFNLGPYLGSTPTFALAQSLAIPAKGVVALTIPTWAPAFTSAGLTSSEIWKSSRTTCSNNTQFATQDTIGQTRNYSCSYRGARLLYSFSYVPNPTPTSSTTSTTTTTNGGTAHH